MKTLRAGLVGLGMMGRHHLRVLSHLDGVELIGVYDPMLNPLEPVNGYPTFNNLEDLTSQKPDYCVVAAPTAFHLELGLALAEAGIHALIEKPLATNSDEAEQLVKAFAKAGLIGGVGHIERFNPAIQMMRQKIEEGLIGNVYQIATRRQGPFPSRISDVGVIKDLATHDIDLTSWVAQKTYESITAHTAFRSGRIHEDMVIAIGRLEGGIIVNHMVNWLTPFKERNTTVIGEHGALVADTLTADLTYFANAVSNSSWENISAFRGVSEGDVIRFALNKYEPLKVEHETFRDALIGVSSDRIVSFSQGLEVLQIADCMNPS
jgi:UDP-N-acetylglucosamine 3-dehydrogenase